MEQLTEVAARVSRALGAAGISYRIVGGFAVFFHVRARDPIAARLTRDVDIAIDRADLPRIAEAVGPLGLEYRHVAGVDMLVDAKQTRARSAIRFVFVREKVRKEYLEPVPEFSSPTTTEEGILLAPVADLVCMKLTSFRLKDKVHLLDISQTAISTPSQTKPAGKHAAKTSAAKTATRTTAAAPSNAGGVVVFVDPATG